jgi:uncharacterized protein (DUF58 family)
MLEPFTPSFFRRLQQLKIRTRRTFLGSRQGSHLSLRKGHGLEFADFRPYAPGDDFRHIDFGVYGRTDRLYVRQFREEQDLNVIVLLDTSASMGFPADQGKFILARDLALALGYIALTDGDTVTFSLLGQRNTPRFIGPRSLNKARKELLTAQPQGSFNMLNEVRAAVAGQKIPGKCFFVSDFLFSLDDQFATLDHLRARNFEISLLQVLAPSEIKLELEKGQLVVDAETGTEVELALDKSSREEYALSLAEHIESLERYCYKAGIDHLLVSSDQPLADIVLGKLPEIGVLK